MPADLNNIIYYVVAFVFVIVLIFIGARLLRGVSSKSNAKGGSFLRGRERRLGVVEAVRLTLSASVLNMVLPSKMGDLVKAFFIRDRDRAATAIAVTTTATTTPLAFLRLLSSRRLCGLGFFGRLRGRFSSSRLVK